VAATGGVEVKNLGDGLMVVYDSPSAALDGAVAMQQGLARHNRSTEEPLELRVGVSVMPNAKPVTLDPGDPP